MLFILLAMDLTSYIATGWVTEDRTMEESYPERWFNITKHNDYFLKSHDIAALFIKTKSSVGQQIPFHKILLHNLG